MHAQTFAAIIITLSATSAFATPTDAVALFDALCVATEGDLNVIEKMVTAAGGKQIPPAAMNADRAVAEFGGKGFTLQRFGKKYSIAATPNQACSVIVQDVQATEVRRLLIANYPITLRQSDASGPQVVTMWRVGAPSRSEGAAVVLNAAKPGFGIDNTVSLGYIPPSAAKKMGIFAEFPR